MYHALNIVKMITKGKTNSTHFRDHFMINYVASYKPYNTLQILFPFMLTVRMCLIDHGGGGGGMGGIILNLVGVIFKSDKEPQSYVESVIF